MQEKNQLLLEVALCTRLTAGYASDSQNGYSHRDTFPFPFRWIYIFAHALHCPHVVVTLGARSLQTGNRVGAAVIAFH